MTDLSNFMARARRADQTPVTAPARLYAPAGTEPPRRPGAVGLTGGNSLDQFMARSQDGMNLRNTPQSATPLGGMGPLFPDPPEGTMITRSPGIFLQTAVDKWDDLSQSWKDLWASHTVAGTAWNALKTVGAITDLGFFPVDAAIRAAIGQPFEEAFGIKGSAATIGDIGTDIATFAVDPLLLGGKIARAIGDVGALARSGRVGRGIESILSPSTMRETVIDLKTGQEISVSPGEANLYWRKMRAEIRKYGLQLSRELERHKAQVGQLTPEQGTDIMLVMNGEQAMHGGIPVGLQPVVDRMRWLLSENTRHLQEIGKLDAARAEYFPIWWKNWEHLQDQWIAQLGEEEHGLVPIPGVTTRPTVARTGEEMFEQATRGVASRTTIRGSAARAGLKTRTLPSMRWGLEHGGELVSTNPYDILQIRLLAGQKWYWGSKFAEAVKALPYVHFVTHGKLQQYLAAGYDIIKDAVFQPTLPPAVFQKDFEHDVQHFMTIDPSLEKGLQGLLTYLKGSFHRLLPSEHAPFQPDPMGGRTFGYTYPGPAKDVWQAFGADQTILMHEIGHRIDETYGLHQQWQQDYGLWNELGELAKLRVSHYDQVAQFNPRFAQYLLDPRERVANLFHAYFHAPKLLDNFPNARRALDDLFRRNPELKEQVDKVIPSVRHHPLTRIETIKHSEYQFFPGIRSMGVWVAPKNVARMINNGLSFSPVRLNGLYDGVRSVGNALNMLQLSLSAFHVSMISIEAAINMVARIPGLLKAGEFTEAAKSVPALIPGLGPVYAGARLALKGKAIRKAAMVMENDPLAAIAVDPQMKRWIDLMVKGGASFGMDRLHTASGTGGFLRDIAGGRFRASVDETLRGINVSADVRRAAPVETPVVRQVMQGYRLAMRALETTMEPIMEMYVPAVKQGAILDLMSDFLRHNPNATEMEIWSHMGEVVDRIDNRFGLMIYDNLMWNKTLKDVAFMMFRAVGWNLGTIREIGGGVVDAVRSTGRVLARTGPADITMRTQYTLTLPIVVALNGALVNYAYTGKGPESLLDYFFPRNGRTVPGTNDPERIAIPSYIKDIYAYNVQMRQTLLNKLHPLFELGQEWLNNRDYYGGIITYPPGGDPAVQTAQWMGRSVLPFGIRGIERQAAEGADIFPLIMNELGFVPAPAYISSPEKQERYQARMDREAWRRLQRERTRGQ